MTSHRVLIAVADESLCRALRTALTTRLHMMVIGEAADADEFYAAAERLDPELVLLDWTLPGLCNNRYIDQCRTSLTQSRAVVLTTNDEQEAAALEAGAAACFRKGANPDRLIELIGGLQA
jgi:two-component system secretion response regulator SsrB